MTRSHYHHRDLRPRMLEAAAKMIAESGLERLTIRALSDSLGVSRTALYRHYANKTELLCAVAADGYSRLARAYERINARSEVGATTRMREIGIAYMEFALANPHHYRLMFGHAIVESDRLPLLRRAARAAYEQYRAAVAAFHQENQIGAMSVAVLTSTIWAATHGWCMLLMDGQIQPEQHGPHAPALLRNTGRTSAPTCQAVSSIIDQQLALYLSAANRS